MRLNAVVGFSNMLTTLWQRERPASVLVGWDTLTVPTYRHESFAGYQSGRVFDDSLLEQLEILPDFVRALGFAAAKHDGYEADDFLAAGARAWKDDVLVATSDRDAFQLVSDRVTILQPAKGVSEINRIGPKKAAELLRQYGTLEAVLADGRFAAEAEDLRLFRRIATMDASAPLPPLEDQTPQWAEASSFVDRLGLGALAGRLASLG